MQTLKQETVISEQFWATMTNEMISPSIIPDCCSISTLGKHTDTSEVSTKEKEAKEKQKRTRTTNQVLFFTCLKYMTVSP